MSRDQYNSLDLLSDTFLPKLISDELRLGEVDAKECNETK